MKTALRLSLIAAVVLLAGCATRTVNRSVVHNYGLDVKLRSEKPFFRPTVAKGYDHPAVISAPRLETILRGIEIDTRKSESSAIRERRAAIHPQIIGPVSEGLSKAFTEADPDQQVVVMALRKQTQKLIFDRKYLTSFVAWIDEGQLYIALSRIEWKWEPKSKQEKLPEPRPEERVMPFTVVSNADYDQAAPQTVRIDWRSEAFGPAPLPEDMASSMQEAPAGATRVGEGAAATGAATAAGAAASEAAGDSTEVESGASAEGAAPTDSDPMGRLDADDYRALADLEEARQSGAIDQAEYERQRSKILAGGN